MRKIVLAGLFLGGCATYAATTDPVLYNVTVGSPESLDSCARTLVFPGEPLCPYADSTVVRERAVEMNAVVSSLTQAQRAQVAEGTVWIGAPAAVAAVAWGRPARVNRTVTGAGEREQWVYRTGEYMYIENGVVTAIQTSR